MAATRFPTNRRASPSARRPWIAPGPKFAAWPASCMVFSTRKETHPFRPDDLIETDL
jgi:hypothetical protein